MSLMKMRHRINTWMVRRGWHLKYPRAYTFYDWVICTPGFTVRDWWEYVRDNDDP